MFKNSWSLVYTCFLPPIRYSQTMVFKDVCITKTPYSKVWNKHKPYVYIFLKFLFQALRSYQRPYILLNFGILSMSYEYFQVFYSYSRPYIQYFSQNIQTLFIQGPMFIHFVKISRPYFYFLPYVYFRLYSMTLNTCLQFNVAAAIWVFAQKWSNMIKMVKFELA